MTSAPFLVASGLVYFVAAGHHLRRIVRGVARPWPPLRVAVYAAAALHAGVLLLRMSQNPAAPLTGVRESVVLLSLLLVGAYLVTARRLRGEGIAVVVLLLCGAGLLAVAPTLPPTPLPPPVVLRSFWLALHVPLCLAAYLLYILSGSAAAMYLLVSTLLKRHRSVVLVGNLPSLDSLDRFSHRMAEVGFPLLTAGLLTGMLWSGTVWGALLMAAPKQTLALVMWLVGAAYFHARFIQGMRGRTCAWLLVIIACVAILGYVAAALHLGRHSFA